MEDRIYENVSLTLVDSLHVHTGSQANKKVNTVLIQKSFPEWFKMLFCFLSSTHCTQVIKK